MHQPSRGPRRSGAALAIASVLAASGSHVANAEPPSSTLCPPTAQLHVLRLATLQLDRQTVCDVAGLQALPQRELVTSLPPSLGQAGAHRWLGVSLKLLVERMGGSPGSVLQLTALNDYTITVPWSDLVRYDPIVAYQRNGVAMSVRDKGPLMLIYPFDAYPELQAQQYLNRSIWQLHAITVK